MNKRNGTLRHKWFILGRMNKKLEQAIQDCAKGEQDFDCNIKDYVGGTEDFQQMMERNGLKDMINIDALYNLFKRSDVV